MSGKTCSRPEKWILLGIPVLFLIGSIMHFLYDLLGKNVLVGLISPINESVWEHFKMVLLPMILWWSLYYCFCGKQNQLDKNKWFTGAITALAVSFIAMPMLYYFYTSAFGVELLWADILILLLAVGFGQLLGLHVYRHGKGCSSALVIAVFAAVILLFILFTFFPPHIPWFQDGVTGGYGILSQR